VFVLHDRLVIAFAVFGGIEMVAALALLLVAL
jgi:hypothetical protein